MMSSPPPYELEKRPRTTLDSLPSELLSPILAQLSDTELLILPTSVLVKGLTEAMVENRFSRYTISLDRAGLGRLYKLCSVPCIASRVQDITILTDRVIKPTRAEFLNFQQNARSHLTCPDMISQPMDEVHVHCKGHRCIACNGGEDSELQSCLVRAGDEQFEIERTATDLAILAWALRRLVNFKHIRIQSSYERHRYRRLAKKQKRWEKQEARYCCHQWGRDPPPAPLRVCTDWDMKLDTQRVFVLVLKAMKMARRSPEGTNESGWFGPRRENDEDWDDIRTSMDHDLRRAQLEYDKLKKESKSRQRDTLHAFHVWENCLRRGSGSVDKSRTEARDIQEQCVADITQRVRDLAKLRKLLECLGLGANAGGRPIQAGRDLPHVKQLAPAPVRRLLTRPSTFVSDNLWKATATSVPDR